MLAAGLTNHDLRRPGEERKRETESGSIAVNAAEVRRFFDGYHDENFGHCFAAEWPGIEVTGNCKYPVT